MILVVGNINFDILFPVERLPGPHEKMECPDALAGFGGSGANTAWWLGRMGLPVSLAGAVGADPFGEAHLGELEKGGVAVTGVDRVSTLSGMAVVFSFGREKRMIRAPGANRCSKVCPGLLEGCRLVYLSGIHLPASEGYALEAYRRGIPVVCGWHAALDGEIARVVSGYILNADEAERITGLANPEESIAALDSRFAAVTLPRGGCVVSRGIEVQLVHAQEREPVDRTGGGDAFAAGFLAGVYLDRDIRECAAMGNRLAAEVIMKRGARPEIQIPDDLKFQDPRPVPGP